MKRTFLFNSILNFLTSSLLSTLCNFILLIYFSKKLDISEFSKYTLLIFLIQAISKFIIFGSDSSLIRFYRDDNQKYKYLINLFLIFLISTVISFLVIISINRSIIQEFIIINNNLLILVFITSVFESFYQIYLAHLVASLNSKKYKKIIFLRNISQFIFIIIIFPIYNSINVILICNISSVLLLFLTFKFTHAFKQITITSNYSKNILNAFLMYGGPLVFYSLFSLTTDYSSRIFMSVNKQLHELANFNFYLQIILYGQGFIALINKTWAPYAFDMIIKSSVDLVFYIRRLIFSFIICTLILLILLILFYESGFFKSVIEYEYLLNFNILILLLPSLIFIFIYMLISPFYYYNKNTIKLTFVNIFCNILNLIISYSLTNNYGISGAIYSFILFNLVFLIIFSLTFPRFNTFDIIKNILFEVICFISLIILFIRFNLNLFFIILFLFFYLISIVIREKRHLIFYKSIIFKS